VPLQHKIHLCSSQVDNHQIKSNLHVFLKVVLDWRKHFRRILASMRGKKGSEKYTRNKSLWAWKIELFKEITRKTKIIINQVLRGYSQGRKPNQQDICLLESKRPKRRIVQTRSLGYLNLNPNKLRTVPAKRFQIFKIKREINNQRILKIQNNQIRKQMKIKVFWDKPCKMRTSKGRCKQRKKAWGKVMTKAMRASQSRRRLFQ